MITRTLFFGNPCHLKTADGQLVAVYNKIAGQEDMPDKKAPIEDVGCVVLEHRQITISHSLMAKLLENNVALITCNEKMMPAGMFLNLEGNTLQSERFRMQIEATEPLKKQLWQQTIAAKIRNQAAVLEKWGGDIEYMKTQARNVKSGDSENAEAKCSLYYWQRLFPHAWKFYRKRDGLPPNNLLNYGYAIIRAVTARALTGSGLLPTLGIWHRNRYNAFCLADDIMEPYRPYVDDIVRGIVEQTSIIEELTLEHKSKLLAVLSTDVITEDGKSPLMVAVQRTSASLAKCYLGESRKIIYPVK